MTNAHVRTVCVGRPRTVTWKGSDVATGIFKAPVDGRVAVRQLNLDGDGQADLVAHGGPDKAVYAYPAEHYPFWSRTLGRELEAGSFGENLLVGGLLEDELAIGDVLRFGDCVLQVTEPRVSCYKLALRLDRADMPALLMEERRTGFYLRVIEEGSVAAGDAIELLRRDPSRLTVAELVRLRLDTGPEELEAVERALEHAPLSEEWRSHLEKVARRLAEPQRPAPVSVPPRAVRLAERVAVTDDVLALTWEAADDAPLTPFQGGQFVTLEVPLDDGRAHRSYSLVGAAGDAAYRVMVKRDAGPGSQALHDRVRVGDVLSCSAPNGVFTLPPGEEPLAFVAGGIGVTPFRGMLATLERTGAGRPVWLFASARSAADEIDGAWLRGLAQRLPSFAYVPRVTSRDGRLTAEQLVAAVPPETRFMICGPQQMVERLPIALAEAGVAPERIAVESFVSAARMADAVTVPEGGLYVSFARSARFCLWTDPTLTLLELAEANRVRIPSSCRVGTCGTCATRVLDGEVQQLGDATAPHADDECLPCIAVPRTKVTLDV
ncbi:MOSC domain-containing protein [Conexibacter woesei]|uniref:MOSC domain containing protein n=1 Tax=Conexibacter woesei (strain DSM 14684 / CCUG 47730 / CIP 108061 / JCM 11494 / NBRC 100937 / ID131577) TaxID=469383 RepID=D3FAR3_CONWI|nr:MOSC domain-containing protein [Conexibacter woesei]ADB51226.1 MOSC domain containing protein [Conexibacter woesei DSM 14684]